ncbi:two component response regulator sensor histidine kinase/response regulator subunits [Leptospira ryugenii]|uniref:histidine kinase n=1 Tax=Leptospira ryugenii TaxID=1917863 RepID=A0A2P2E333_9LEPT|nr:response regulator [Leptospira ryugenii]GBF51269.1 two component response regulator sensor histidine kinase/response regulator subunits [Leptospira ryugenii]
MSKILIIDDEEEIRIALKRILSREGYEIEHCSNVEEGLNLINKEDNFSLVISDILMSGLSGIDLIKHISESQQNLPVILMTGNPNLSSAESAVRYKAFDYLSKPVDRLQLINVVKSAIDSKIKKDVEFERYHQSELMEKVLRSQNLDLNRQNAAIINATSDSVITINSNLEIISINNSTLELFKYPDYNAIIGQKVEVLFSEQKREKYLHQIKLVVKEKKEKKTINLTDVSLIRSDGNSFLTDIAICSYEIDGDIYFTGVIRDVTQKKIMVQQLIDSERRAFLSTVAASIGHEINNSLTAIQGFTEMAIKENADIQLKNRALQVTMNQMQKLQALTANLLLLGKSKSITSKESEFINLNKSITSILDVFKETARLKYCQIIWQEPTDELNIHMNFDQFNVLLTNLLLNAADATENAGTIQILVEPQIHFVLLQIKDDGIGMNDEIKAKIFEPYFTTKELGKGTGLGLFVVKQIIDEHNIDFKIDSVENVGTTFELRFKLAN